jgi:hypothetical protein
VNNAHRELGTIRDFPCAYSIYYWSIDLQKCSQLLFEMLNLVTFPSGSADNSSQPLTPHAAEAPKRVFSYVLDRATKVKKYEPARSLRE